MCTNCFSFLIEERDNQEIMTFILCCLRLDVDITELHSWITRSEAVLQSPEFAIYRKEGNFSDLKEKVNVGSVLRLMHFAFLVVCAASKHHFFASDSTKGDRIKAM